MSLNELTRLVDKGDQKGVFNYLAEHRDQPGLGALYNASCNHRHPTLSALTLARSFLYGNQGSNSEERPVGLEKITRNRERGPLDTLQKQLMLWVKYTYEGRVPLNKLYEKGEEIRRKIEGLDVEGLGGSNSAVLTDAFEFISQLHDSSVNAESLRGPLYYHMVQLAAKIEKV